MSSIMSGTGRFRSVSFLATASAAAFAAVLAVGCSAFDWTDWVNEEPASDGSLSDGLIVHYSFNGPPRDLSGRRNHGRAYGIHPARDRFGKPGRAYAFDGTTSYVAVEDRATLPMTGALSLSIWAKGIACSACNGSLVGLVSKGSIIPFGISVDDGDRVLARVVSDGVWTDALADDQAIERTRWYHYAAVFEPFEFLRVFLDGQVIAEVLADVPGSIDDSSLDLWIGTRAHSRSQSVPFFYFEGVLDDVRIYDRALSKYDIDSLSRDR